MHVLVLGGNGFIGSHAVEAIVDAGHRVTVMDIAPHPRYAHGRPFEFVEASVSVIAGMPGVIESADAICHLAYSTVPATSNADPAADVMDNLVSSVRLLESLRACGKNRMIYLSSGGAVYGPPQTLPIAENHPLNPISSYGVTKVAFEKYLNMYGSLYGLRPTVIRPSNPYGPGQGKIGLLGVVSTFLNAAATGESATIWGDGSLIRDFVYVGDLARLVVAALEQDKPGIYNCGYGTGTSLIELLGEIEACSGRRVDLVRRPGRDFDPKAVVLDIEKAQSQFGWTPRISLDAGLRQTWGWMKARGLVH